jgi:TRAP-type C4-dicarboxylate transport system permease large subunit
VTIEEAMRTIWPFSGVMFAVLMLVTPAVDLAGCPAYLACDGGCSRVWSLR